MNPHSGQPPSWMGGEPSEPTDASQYTYGESSNRQEYPEAPQSAAYPQEPTGQNQVQHTWTQHQPQPQPGPGYGHFGDGQPGYAPPTVPPGQGPAPVEAQQPMPAPQQPVYDPQSQTPGAYPPGPPAPGIPRDRPRSGWRQSLRSIASGFVTFGGTRRKEDVALLAERVRQPIRSDFRLAILSLKGGVGKTTVTVGLGSALASLRGDRVIAVDANPDLGTLARRIPAQTASTVRDLLQDEHVERYVDVRRHTSQAPSRLEVLASERDPAISEAFSENEYLRVIEILENHYNMILTDCGTGLVHSAMAGVIKSATSLVLVTSPALDGAQSAVATLDWLVAHGYEQLAREAVVVIAASKSRQAPVDVNMLREYFLGRTRAVQIIPYDDHLAVGGFVDLDQMQSATRSAFLELAATLVEPFAVPVPVPGAFGPFGGMVPPQR